MKKVISIVLLISVLFSVFAVSSSAASAAYKATWSLKASVADSVSGNQAADKTNYQNNKNKVVYNAGDNKTIGVYPGQVVWVTMNLKTGSSYYAGSLSAHIFYNTKIFTSTNQSSGCYIWNNTDSYPKICTKLGSPFSKMVDSFKERNYPSNWSSAQKSASEFYSVGLAPDASKSLTTYANVDCDLVTVPIYVKSNAKVGDSGSIFMTGDDQRTTKNTNGLFFLGYFEKGDLLKTEVTRSDKINFDLSATQLNFVVMSKSASGVAIEEDSVSMNYKSTKTLNATVKGASGVKPIWSTSNPKVATVDENGNVTAVGRGSAEITASYGNYSDTCKVNVDYSFGQWLIKILLFGWIWY